MIPKINFLKSRLLVLFLFGSIAFFSEGLNAQPNPYSLPPWAPAHIVGVRYYYLPDIETYYDIINQDFVYLENGQWLFSYSLPPMYSGYDLYNGFVITLDVNVYQPWMHHHFYVSNYPRYYYRSIYRNDEVVNLRGFSENERKPIFWKQEERARISELRARNNSETRRGTSRPPQNMNYYGKNIGKPVKVQKQMRGRSEERRDVKSEDKRDSRNDNHQERR